MAASSLARHVQGDSCIAPPKSHEIYADLSAFGEDILGGLFRLQAVCGPIAAVRDGSSLVVFLFDPTLNQQVLSDPETFHARFFAIRGPKRSSQRRLTCGLLAMNGDQHRRNRRLVKEPFSLKTIVTYLPTIVQQTDEMLARWRVGQVLDLADEMRRFMLRLTSTLLFGLDETEQAFRIGDMLARWVAMNHHLGAGALVPDDVFSTHYEELLTFAKELESEILGMIHRRRAGLAWGRDVLSILVRTYDEEGGLSDEELVGQAAVLFGAAHMTTAHSLAWTLFLLAQHPLVMQRVCTAPDDEALLERVIKESMRILPASAYSQRINMRPARLGPLELPRGTGIVFTPLVVHHLHELYPRPERFDPDRWQSIRPSPYAYFPFGAGPRMCIGGPLAMEILRTVLPRILSRCRLSVVPRANVSAQVEATMLSPVSGIPMVVRPADGPFESSPITGNIHTLVDLSE
jgi:cytochrome P450